MGSLEDLDIEVQECNSNFVELEFIDNSDGLGIIVVELYHIKDGRRSFVDLENLYFDSTIRSDTLTFYLTDHSMPDGLEVELGRKGDFGIDKRTIGIDGSKDQENTATQKGEGDTGSIDKDTIEGSSLEGEDSDKSFFEVLMDVSDELLEEHWEKYKQKYNENNEENKGEKQDNSSYQPNKVSKDKGKVSKESKVKTDKNHYTETDEGKHEHLDKHEKHEKQNDKSGKKDGSKNKSEWIVELSKKGYKPKEIALELDTTQDHVYVVRSNNGLGETGNKKQQIIELDRKGYPVEQIAELLDTSKSYIYKVKSKN